MEELLTQTGYQLRGFKKGEVVEGIVTEKTKNTVWVDLGAKTEGIIPEREVKAASQFIQNLKVGDKIKATVFHPENENGQPLLSLRKTLGDYLWSEFEEKLKTGEPLRVKGKEVNKGGLVVEANGVAGFIPASCFSAKLAGKMETLINRELEAKLIEVDRQKNRLILSEKEVSEAGLIEEQKEALKKIKVGEVFSGEVTGVMSFGLFVRINTEKHKTEHGETRKKTPITLEGLVHISEISWEKVEDPSIFFKLTDKVKVKVLGVDKKSGKLNLSIKQLEKDPWEDIETKYLVEAKVKGVVSRLVPFGVFVNLEPGIEGLIHISKLPLEKSFKVDDKVECFVDLIDKNARKMSLELILKEKPIGYK